MLIDLEAARAARAADHKPVEPRQPEEPRGPSKRGTVTPQLATSFDASFVGIRISIRASSRPSSGRP